MKTLKLHISEIKVNPSNPREIEEHKFDLLVDSILVFPQMLSIREIVLDEDKISLGGNMRYRSLSEIKGLKIEEIKSRIESTNKAKKINSSKWVNDLVKYWLNWQKKPLVPVKIIERWTEDEKREFVIKDNASFGKWIHDMLANEWDSADLLDWGLDVWDYEIKDDEDDEPEEDKPIRYILEVDCKTESERQEVEELLEARGYKVKKKGGE